MVRWGEKGSGEHDRRVESVAFIPHRPHTTYVETFGGHSRRAEQRRETKDKKETNKYKYGESVGNGRGWGREGGGNDEDEGDILFD